MADTELTAMLAKYNLGWLRQPPDARDYQYAAPEAVLRALPPSVDLLASLPPVLNQGNLGSCGPNAAACMIGQTQAAQGLPVEPASRLFTYWNTRQLMGTTGQDSGVNNRDMLKALNQQGFCKEVLWPYVIETFRQQPTATAYAAAVPNKITQYAVVSKTLDQMRGCLADGRTMLFGFDVFQSMMTSTVERTGDVPNPGRRDGQVGGHDVTFYGYDDAVRRFKFRNSWGAWGNGGNGTISYEYATSGYADDFWVIQLVPGAPPPPPPPPPPVLGRIVLDLERKLATLPPDWHTAATLAAVDGARDLTPQQWFELFLAILTVLRGRS